MAGTIEDSARHGPAELEAGVRDFLGSTLPIGDLRQQVGSLLAREGILGTILASTREDRAKFVDKTDQVYLTLDAQDVGPLTVLGEVCSATNRLPPSIMISAGLKTNGGVAVTTGGLTDIWLGHHDGKQVGIRSFRLYPKRKLREAKKILWKRVAIWKRFSHPNVTAFLGVDTKLFPLALVYEWAENGNVMQYIVSHPDVHRPLLLWQVAMGLLYLHSLDVPHGNLKGANVLVDGSGHVRLADYGLAPTNSLIAAEPIAGNMRWLAPEIISPPPHAIGILESKPADVFASAMLAVEIFTGEVPFPEQRNPGAAIRIFRGDRPEFPPNAEAVGLTVEIWGLLQRCWHKDPTERPTIDDVVSAWEQFLGNSKAQPAQLDTQTPKNIWRKLFCRLN